MCIPNSYRWLFEENDHFYVFSGKNQTKILSSTTNHNQLPIKVIASICICCPLHLSKKILHESSISDKNPLFFIFFLLANWFFHIVFIKFSVPPLSSSLFLNNFCYWFCFVPHFSFISSIRASFCFLSDEWHRFPSRRIMLRGNWLEKSIR